MDEYRVRVRIFASLVLVVLGILGLRLAKLQIMDTDEYTGESRSNAVREIRVLPARGAFVDRNGTIMVDNEQIFTITLTPRYFDESKIGLLAHLMEVPDSVVVAKLEEAKQYSPFQASKVFREVPYEIFSRVLENHYLLPGVNFEVEQKRRYATRARAAHVLGYIREISERALKQRGADGYRRGDFIGTTGLEKNYEYYLRGRMGSEFRLVNVHGRMFDSYKEGTEDKQPLSGYNAKLTLDSRVQALAESLFVGKRGAAVAIDPQNGGVIALMSAPAYDPDIFTKSIDQDVWDYLNNSPEKPLLNRATMNYMPPGSTWKPLMALMALQEGLVKPGETYTCHGGHPLGHGVRFTCMEVHGALDVVHAIQHSCNTFFFEMMNRAGPNRVYKYAHMFGFGEKAPMEIDEQTAGLVADSAYFDRKVGVGQWGYGWYLSMGIGQGDMAVTPLQLARYVSAVANGGTLYAPHMVDELWNPETGDRLHPSLPAPRRIPIKKEYFDMVRQGMRLVMEQGTGRLAQIPGIPSGGKTGTAQASGGRIDNSLFIMFAPWDHPRIAIAVEVENAGQGAWAAAPIASLMAELYLTGKLPPKSDIRWARALRATSQPLPGAESFERAKRKANAALE
ncbi:MAG TPA: penicillin-binding protein 2 [Rhodothermales bacterium]|nr:penicillin-binding protein 2 [Rhodothermales bacterium]